MQNNWKKYLLIIVALLVVFLISWFLFARTNKTNTQEASFAVSSRGAISYLNNILDQGGSSITTDEDIVAVDSSGDKLLVHTVPDENYPQGKFIVYQDQNIVLELPAETYDARWVGGELIYSITEDNKSEIISQSGSVIATLSYQYVGITPAGDNVVVYYALEDETIESDYLDRASGVLSRVSIPDGFLIASASDNLEYLLLAPINGPTEPWQIYVTANNRLEPLQINLFTRTLTWVPEKGFLGLGSDLESTTADKLILTKADGEQTVLYQSDTEISSLLIDKGRALMVTRDGKELEAQI